ncbi:MAG: class I SAM-dependent methyltransferase [Ignavibacteriales bacterium]|nr:MAG: class I SAM-dependent methyltransferase [Ignavibacteriales bacterium]
MYYDPVKDIFASLIRRFTFLRIFFYKLLNLFFLRTWYVKRELKNIRKKFGSREINIFDAGTGYGQYTYFMTRHLQPNKIYAVDVKEDWIKDNKEFFKNRTENVTFGIEDLTSINYIEKFDLIVCVDVMEHIEDDITVFKNFYNALKKGGYVLINTPSVYGGSDVHGDEESFIGEHARTGYSDIDLKDKLSKAGFNEFYFKYSYGFWGDKAWRLAIKYPMLLLNISKIFFLVLPVYFLITFPFALLMMLLDYNLKNKTGTGITYVAGINEFNQIRS